MARLAVIGNISIDHRVRPDGIRDTALGGAALHIALAATRAGLDARPVSVIGTDLRGLQRHLPGLDLTAVAMMSGASATFTLAYDGTGDLTSTEAEYGSAVHLTGHALRHLSGQHDDTYHVCCRSPLDVARVIHEVGPRPFSVDFTLPSAPQLIAAVKPYLPRARAVFVNSAEYSALAQQVPVESLATLVVSDGANPARLFRNGRLFATAVPPATSPTQFAGAGDTLVGTYLAAHAAGRDETSALRTAVVAASAHTIHPALRPPTAG